MNAVKLKISGVIVFTIAFLMLFSGKAFAAEEVSLSGTIDASSLADSDELAEGYINSVLYEDVLEYDSDGTISGVISKDAANASYGTSVLSGESLLIYNALKELICDLAENGGYAYLEYVPEDSYSSSADSATEFLYEILDYYDYDTIIDSLIVDSPYELYWFDKTSGMKYSASVYKDSSGVYNITKLKFYFYVSDDYLDEDIDANFGVSNDRSSLIQTAKENALEIVEEYASCDIDEQLTAYKDEICELTDYNYDAASSSTAYGDPWQIIYVFDGDDDTTVVCEGYSKAFQYLCDLTWPDNDPITCYTVTGYMAGGSHMWNLVAINYESYLVDVTNSDDGTVGVYSGLFLASANDTKSSSSFGYTAIAYYSKTSYATYTYSYDSDTIALYSEDILTLSSTSFADALEYYYENYTEEITEDNVSLSFTKATYSGTKKSPAVTVYNNAGKKLTKGTDYTVTYESGRIDVGTYTITVKGIGNYTGTVEKTLTIKQQTLSDDNVTLNFSKTTYSGTKKSPGVVVLNSAGDTLSKGTDYTVGYQSGRIDAGTYTVTIKGCGNYTGTVEKTLTIKQQTLSDDNVTLNFTRAVYSGTKKSPGVVVLNSAGETLTKGTDYTVSYEDGRVEIGYYTVTISGSGNYTGTIEKTFKIVPADVDGISVTTSSGKIKVEWDAVHGDNISYTIKLTDEDGNEKRYVTSSLSKTISSLSSGTYTISIRPKATVDEGIIYGNWSDDITVTIN